MVANIRIANGNSNLAPPHSPPVITYNPGMVPQSIILPNGNTFYPGETIVFNIEPTFDYLGTADTMPPATGQDEVVDHAGSQCSTAPSIAQSLRGAGGNILERWCCPNSGEIWLCEEGQPDFYCWESDHPFYVAPIIGVTQAEADLHAATENANRAAHEAGLARAKAHSAEMRSTAFSETAAEKADTAYEEKKATLVAAADTAKARREAYDRDKALADADAKHRAARKAIATGTATPEVIATAPSSPTSLKLCETPLRALVALGIAQLARGHLLRQSWADLASSLRVTHTLVLPIHHLYRIAADANLMLLANNAVAEFAVWPIALFASTTFFVTIAVFSEHLYIMALPISVALGFEPFHFMDNCLP